MDMDMEEYTDLVINGLSEAGFVPHPSSLGFGSMVGDLSSYQLHPTSWSIARSIARLPPMIEDSSSISKTRVPVPRGDPVAQRVTTGTVTV